MVQAVIGAAFGDEGKGLLTDAICAYCDVDLVVRYNGGAQAGHTVTHGSFTTPSDKNSNKTHQIRHVFHHFGSGTLRGAFTYLGRRFVTNPLLFRKERMELIQLTEALRAAWPEMYNEAPLCASYVYADPRCYVTTPYDMLINEMLETKRGDARHGSCGVGFGETIERSENGWKPPLSLQECGDETHLMETLEAIRKDWVPNRMAELGLKPEDDPLRWEYMNSKIIMERWAEDAVDMWDHMSLCQPHNVLEGEILFEGAQGLLLDQDHWFFPHVTRSKTGGAYIKEMLAEYNSAGETKLNLGTVHYVMRSYMTRHGAGPFPTELKGVPDDYYRRDKTNVPNDWQGSLRQGALDVQLIKEAIDKDFEENFSDSITTDCDAFVTWMDHPLVKDDVDGFLDGLAGRLETQIYGYSYGPSCDDVEWY